MSLIIFLARVHMFSMTSRIRSINDDMITLPRKVVSIALGEVMYSEMVIKFQNFPPQENGFCKSVDCTKN